MTFTLLKHSPFFRSITTSHLHLRFRSFFSLPTQTLFKENNNWNDVYNLSPLLPGSVKHDLTNCNIDLVDDETWNVSSGLAQAWRTNNNNNTTPSAPRTVGRRKVLGSEDEDEDEVMEYLPPNKDNPDWDEIEDMRIRGSLFYKLEKYSIEYEDHNFNFHGKKNKEKKEEKTPKKGQKHSALVPSVEKVVKNAQGQNEIANKEPWKFKSLSLEDHNQEENLGFISRFDEVNGCTSKPNRFLTFNQVTAPFHEPFCLDIHVTKGSVRASVIHRVTSNVVAVAHSISKDFKFDLGSPKSKSRDACALVGKVLAQRAMDDDIYNIVYTPRDGDKLEGKLQIVLQAIIDGGVEVKVKLKQRRPRKAHGSVLRTRH